MDAPLQRELAAFLAYLAVERRLSPHTLDAYRRDLGDLARWLAAQGIDDWHALGQETLRTYVASLHRGVPRGARAGLSGKSLQRHLSAVRSFYRWLGRGEAEAVNPATGLRAPKAARRLPQVLDPDEAGALVQVPTDAPLGVRDRAMLELFYSSGLRLSELCGLRWQALDLAEGLVTVTGKGGKTRLVPVGSHARAALEAWRVESQGAGVASANAHVFPGRAGGAVTPAPARATAGPVQARASAPAAPQLREPRAGIVRRPARRAGAAGPRRHRDHAGVYASGLPASGEGV